MGDALPSALAGTDCSVRRATAADVPAIVALLADDPRGAIRETGELAAYDAAFTAVDADPAQLLVVVEAADGSLVATLQLTTDADRTDAQRIYDRLGFTASHVGYKKALT